MKKNQKQPAANPVVRDEELKEFIFTSTRMLAKFAIEIRAIVDVLVDKDLTTMPEFRDRLMRLGADLGRFQEMHRAGDRLGDIGRQ